MKDRNPIGQALVVGLSAVAAGWVTDKALTKVGVDAPVPVSTFIAALVGHYTWEYIGSNKQKRIAKKADPKRLAKKAKRKL